MVFLINYAKRFANIYIEIQSVRLSCTSDIEYSVNQRTSKNNRLDKRVQVASLPDQWDTNVCYAIVGAGKHKRM